MKKTLRLIAIFTLTALIIFAAGEYIICGIFYSMEGQAFIEHQLLMFSAIMGDVFIALGLLLLLAFVNRRSDWFLDKWERKDIVIHLLYSTLLAFYFEAHALYTGRWGYSESMPLVKGTSIGLVPVLFLIILIPLIFYITEKIYKFRYDK
ncbi:hypothetical protein C8C77_1231 [Halanaerobium saccharolyticum]|uniref:Uncharacterized protein n=1 Tax=Halanaerobium saccharolyticum TaxID=43595 RepID=A0A4R7YV59_9FIRM|nr:hypothetical protein [Halanaerobium saccharolyticum]RAK06465.1 hypothetical protein C7958_1221 [Halanaerobium saccharolyticum]TDW01009.1 hypothetical protein C8C77_1231 [Halanaerobium saccharolyticum]TDX52590.1 hypothetical protein C7956_1221 [Halanaerobium saccharolyticum]